MRHITRTLTVATLAAGIIATAFPQPSFAFDSAEQKCRAAVAKGGAKMAKTALTLMSKCHKLRDASGGADCNSLAVADPDGKYALAATKFELGIAKKCISPVTAGAVLYQECPAPCADVIGSFTDVTTCLTCLSEDNTEGYSDHANGTPMPAPIVDDAALACHASIVKNGGKLYNTVIKNIAKCQATAEKADPALENVNSCTNAQFNTLTETAYQKAQLAISEACAAAQTAGTLPSIDPCDGEITAFALAACVVDSARVNADELVTAFLNLPAGGVTTTTTTSTTLPPEAGCPDLGELVLFSKITDTVCTTNAECGPLTCDTSLGRCRSVTDLDSGWNGLGHNADINNDVRTRATLSCPGTAGACGTCNVTGIDPEPNNCRCANNTYNICDQPFVADADDCGGAICDCYFGAPFPLTAGGTPVCIANRFSQNISGTANVDAGSGSISASLRTKVYIGPTLDLPCPVCGGKCTVSNTYCLANSDCTSNNCVQDIPDDGIRAGLCINDANLTDNAGMACDVMGTNTSFPSILGQTSPGFGGAGYSLDCFPAVGKLVNGSGLRISLTQTTGVSSLSAGVDCDAAGPGTDLCPCLMCSKDNSLTCTSNADCSAQGGTCSGVTSSAVGTLACTQNTDCQNFNAGPCGANHPGFPGGLAGKCYKDYGTSCANNTACLNQDEGTCGLSTCTSKAQGGDPRPNNCTSGICVDQGGGEGLCDAAGPDQGYCDALVKANGAGIASCATNADCVGLYGNCTLSERVACFLDPIVATGSPNPQFPVGAATFCVGPTPSSGINSAAGLPGPGRVTNQAAATTYCATNHAVPYQPGIGGCPP